MSKKILSLWLAVITLCPALAAVAQTRPLPSPFIVVDQFGYLPHAQKIAVIRDPVIGFDYAQHFVPGKMYQVVKLGSGTVVFLRNPLPWHDGAVDPLSGDRAWQFDFSKVKEQGRYFIRDHESGFDSAPFWIGKNICE